MQLLIDGDLLLYKFGCTNEIRIEWEEGVTSEWTDIDSATQELDIFLKQMQETTETSGFLICFSCPKNENFRYKVLPSYKHNRADKPKPQLHQQLKDYMTEKYPHKIKPMLEADDVLGILGTLHPRDYLIASIDKDLKQIPGRHYNWKNGEIFEVSESDADYWFYRQVLTGDSTDGYSGCPKIGAVKAKGILDDILLMAGLELPPEELNEMFWEAIVAAYESKGLTEEDAIQQARVARILRKDDYDFKKGDVKLWTPSQNLNTKP